MTSHLFKPNLLLIDATRDKLHLELMYYGVGDTMGEGGAMPDDEIRNSITSVRGVMNEVKFEYLNEVLLKEIWAFLSQHGIVLSDIRVLAVNHGPGAYNGIRISIVVAKTIAFFQKIPIYTFNGFMVMDAWQQSSVYDKFLKNTTSTDSTLKVMVLNPSRNIFFLALYITENSGNGKSKQLGNITPLGKTNESEKKHLKDWLLAATKKSEVSIKQNLNFPLQTIADVFKLTKEENSLLVTLVTSTATTGLSHTRLQPSIKWFFFDESSYQNFSVFVDEEHDGQMIQEKIIWDKVFQSDESTGDLSKEELLGSYSPVVKMALRNSTGEVMEVTPHYYRNFGE